ncbi:hypothetical protein MMC22_007875 [Lobaria immixta]|nr:hypothetical protein [Lobaria immixta]
MAQSCENNDAENLKSRLSGDSKAKAMIRYSEGIFSQSFCIVPRAENNHEHQKRSNSERYLTSFYGGFAGGTTTIATASHDDHLHFRRLLALASSQKALTDQEPLIKQYIDLLIERLHERTDTKQNMSAWSNVCVYVNASAAARPRVHSSRPSISLVISPLANPSNDSKRPSITVGSL